MTPFRMNCIANVSMLVVLLATSLQTLAQDERANYKDSYRYYGPNKLWKTWNDPENKDAAAQRLGRDTWIHWTWGNQKTLRKASVLAGNLPVPISIDLFRLLDSRKRDSRFKDLGLINEPNCRECTEEEKKRNYDLWLDVFESKNENYYPVDYDLLGTNPPRQMYSDAYKLKYPRSDKAIDLRHFGHPSGIVGVRLFKNPAFTEEAKKKWDVKKYFENPGKVEPPYLVGFSCAFCHIAFDPNNPPKDPEKPRWENLAANIGNQYLREGELFFGKGRILFGDKHSETKPPDDPYQTSGLTEKNFLYHYGATQQPGTSETSRISYDFINNPNTINPIYGLRSRPTFEESTVWGRKRTGKEAVWHALKDGADAVGIEWAIMRVPLNIGCEGDYWIDQLFNPVIGRKQRPVRIMDLLTGLPPEAREAVEKSTGFEFDFSAEAKERQAEYQKRYSSKYGQEVFGQDLQEAWYRIDGLKHYLLSYEPARLVNATPATARDLGVKRQALSKGEEQRKRGAKLFGQHCAECHSSKKPYTKWDIKDTKRFYELSAQAEGFLENNFLSDERRIAATKSKEGLGTNMARALGTNGLDADVWAEFSSPEYKGLKPIGRMFLNVPVFDQNSSWSDQRAIRVEFDPPGGGRGYYRTPSLISLWATAPYLHNNSVGDYYVIKHDKTRMFFPNDGRRIGEQDEKDKKWVDYPIDVSVEGRLAMFEDGMKKLLNPSQRRRWVKRTSEDSALIPDLSRSVHQIIAHVAGEALKQEVRLWVKKNPDLPAPAAEVVTLLEQAFEKAIADYLENIPRDENLKKDWEKLHAKGRDLAIKLFEETLKRLPQPEKSADPKKAQEELKTALNEGLKQEFLKHVEALHQRIYGSLKLNIKKGTPVNLYANLHSASLPHVLLAHARHREDPRGLAEALLQMSECPDLVEDDGHTYGSTLTDAEKDDLIEFLKTF